ALDATCSAEVDGLRAHQNDSTEVLLERAEHVEQNTSGLDVFDSHWLAGHHVSFRFERGPRVPFRHRGSFLRIQASTASPSAGIRALPVRQSSATCAVDTYVAPP